VELHTLLWCNIENSRTGKSALAIVHLLCNCDLTSLWGRLDYNHIVVVV